MPENWRFLLAQSSDLSNIADLRQARGRQLNVEHNRGGSLGFNFPMTDEIAGEIEPINTCVKAYRYSMRDALWKGIWSGPVWTIEESLHEERMNVNCIGWQGMFDKRLLRRDKTYVNADDGAIIQDLLAEANLLTLPDIAGYNVPVPAGWANQATPTHVGWGGTLPNEGTGGATAYTTALRNKTYQRYQSIGAAMQELTEYENGCDLYITPEDRKLWVYRKRQTITDVVFGFGWGPNNIQQFQRQLDASTVVNFMQATGRPGTTPQYADTRDPAFGGWRIGPNGTLDPSPNSQDEYGLFEEVVSLSDVGDVGVLGTYAAGEIYVRYRPRIVYSITPFPFSPGNSVPEPFVDYNVGDRVLLTAKLLPRLTIENQAVRVFGISVTIDEEGNERLGALQTSPT